MVSVPGAKCFLDMDMLLDFRKKHHTKMMWQSVSDILLHVTPFNLAFCFLNAVLCTPSFLEYMAIPMQMNAKQIPSSSITCACLEIWCVSVRFNKFPLFILLECIISSIPYPNNVHTSSHDHICFRSFEANQLVTSRKQ